MEIKKADLENLFHMTGEIRDIDQQIQEIEKNMKDLSKQKGNNYVGDTYRDYSQNAKGSLKIIQGYEYDYKQQQKYCKELRAKRNARIDKKMEIERELEKIPDVIICRIIRLKFFDRFSWESVAIAVDPSKSGEAMRKRLARYLKIPEEKIS